MSVEKITLHNMGDKEKKKPSKKKRGFHEIMFAETNYYIKNGLRHVYPYKFTFTAHVKLRWMGLRVLDVFKREFHMETVEYYEKAIKDGKIRVNDKLVSKDYILTGKDILQTGVHRHEPPVINEPIEFVENNEDMVVINKPSSIPVHPCGRYRHNTIVFLLGKEHGLDSLHTIHRIDRLTSGILMFAKTTKKASEMEKAVKGRQVEKEYIARVVGEFPIEEILVDKPILTVSHKVGVCRVHDQGKECRTTFKRRSFNGNTSLVQCTPHTGRMHQIRVHLQWLGYPIVNDPIYNHQTAWGGSKGKHGDDLDIDFVIAELLRTRKDRAYGAECDTNSGHEPERKKQKTGVCSSDKTLLEGPNKVNANNTAEEKDVDEHCNKEKSPETSQPSICHKLEEKLFNMDHQSLEGENRLTGSEVQIDIKASKTVTSQEYENGHVENNATSSGIPVERSNDGTCYTSVELGEQYHDENCTDCNRTWREPLPHELVMYLHAHRYKGVDWEYKTKLPNWAADDWRE